MTTYTDYIRAICEEFTDTVLIDRKNHSILVNVAKEWFKVLDQKLATKGFKLVFKQPIAENYTCSYILVKARVDN